MTRHRLSSGSRYRQGFSLIELMISLSIGLIITGAVFSAYMGAAGASRMSEAQGRMNEDAQAALTILTQQLRMAGNNPNQTNRIDDAVPTLSSRRNPVYLPESTYDEYALLPSTFEISSFRIRGCDGQFSNITTATNLDHLTCAAGASTAPDSIALNYEADAFNTVPTTSSPPLPTDCLGNALSTITAKLPTVVGTTTVNTEVTYYVADNRFYVGTASSIPSLYCKGNGGNSTPQPLVENIEDMQFLYGATNTTAMVAGYLRADAVISQADMAALTDDAARWVKVRTVRVCVLVRSEAPVVSDAVSARYRKCDGTLETNPPDLRLRRAYSTTVVLRNPQLKITPLP